MIGAGFSRNADPQSDSKQKFPLWRDIIRPLIDELLPPCPHCPRSDPCPAHQPPGCQPWERRRGLFADSAGASGARRQVRGGRDRRACARRLKLRYPTRTTRRAGRISFSCDCLGPTSSRQIGIRCSSARSPPTTARMIRLRRSSRLRRPVLPGSSSCMAACDREADSSSRKRTSALTRKPMRRSFCSARTFYRLFAALGNSIGVRPPGGFAIDVRDIKQRLSALPDVLPAFTDPATMPGVGGSIKRRTQELARSWQAPPFQRR
jgi:hypothetical protein